MSIGSGVGRSVGAPAASSAARNPKNDAFSTLDGIINGGGGAECPVCLAAMQAGVSRTDCGHLFHTECLATALKYAPRCPMCRESVRGSAVVRPPRRFRIGECMQVPSRYRGGAWCLRRLCRTLVLVVGGSRLEVQTGCGFRVCSMDIDDIRGFKRDGTAVGLLETVHGLTVVLRSAV